MKVLAVILCFLGVSWGSLSYAQRATDFHRVAHIRFQCYNPVTHIETNTFNIAADFTNNVYDMPISQFEQVLQCDHRYNLENVRMSLHMSIHTVNHLQVVVDGGSIVPGTHRFYILNIV